MQAPSGVLLIDKAQDMTSHDVVAIARRSLGIKKIGHCGTLDPMATGLLMLVVGKATKLQDKLMCEHKDYGQEVVREPRPVEVFGHQISRVAVPEVDFTVQCSKGFYVRSYAYDIGKALGCGAHLSALRRTRSGSFTLERAVTVDTLKTAPREELFRAMLSLEELADILIAR